MEHKKSKNFFKSLSKNQFLSDYVIKHCSPRVKSILIKNRLRSIDELILYKSTHNGFKSLLGAGRKTQLEIDSLLSQFIIDKMNDVRKGADILPNNTFLSNYVVKHGSPRVKSILIKNRLRSIDELILYKSTHNGFKSLPGAGRKTQLEIDILLSQFMIDEINVGSNAAVKLNARMSRRAINAISKICKPDKPGAVVFMLASFTIDRFSSQLKPINFHDINGIGSKTSDELVALRNELSSVLTTRFEELWS